MKYILSLTAMVAVLASCTQETNDRAMVLPVAPEFVEVAPTVAVTGDCEPDLTAPVNFNLMLNGINGNPVAAPIIGTLTVDISGATPTAFCTNPYADSPTEWLNGYFDEDNYLRFDIPFTLTDGTVEYTESILEFNPNSGFLLVQSMDTSDGIDYTFVGTLICE